MLPSCTLQGKEINLNSHLIYSTTTLYHLRLSIAFMYWLFTVCFQPLKTQTFLLCLSSKETSQWCARTLDKYLKKSKFKFQSVKCWKHYISSSLLRLDDQQTCRNVCGSSCLSLPLLSFKQMAFAMDWERQQGQSMWKCRFVSVWWN